MYAARFKLPHFHEISAKQDVRYRLNPTACADVLSSPPSPQCCPSDSQSCEEDRRLVVFRSPHHPCVEWPAVRLLPSN